MKVIDFIIHLKFSLTCSTKINIIDSLFIYYLRTDPEKNLRMKQIFTKEKIIAFHMLHYALVQLATFASNYCFKKVLVKNKIFVASSLTLFHAHTFQSLKSTQVPCGFKSFLYRQVVILKCFPVQICFKIVILVILEEPVIIASFGQMYQIEVANVFNFDRNQW